MVVVFRIYFHADKAGSRIAYPYNEVFISTSYSLISKRLTLQYPLSPFSVTLHDQQRNDQVPMDL